MTSAGKVLVGDRVIAAAGSGGLIRHGVVTAKMDFAFLQPTPQYLVRFDGDKGNSGPCHFVMPEGQ